MRLDRREIYQIIIEDEGTVLATKCRLATDFIGRLKGLMFRDDLNDGEALVLIPCNSVHTFFMRFPIDVIFLDRDGNTVCEKRNLVPGKAISHVIGAWAAIELKGGKIDSLGICNSLEGKRVQFKAIRSAL